MKRLKKSTTPRCQHRRSFCRYKLRDAVYRSDDGTHHKRSQAASIREFEMIGKAAAS